MARCQSRLNGVHVNLGLAGSRDAVEQESLEALLPQHRADSIDRGLLVRV